MLEYPVEQPQDSVADDFFFLCERAQPPAAGQQSPRVRLGKGERGAVGKRKRSVPATIAEGNRDRVAVELLDAKPAADEIGASVVLELAFMQQVGDREREGQAKSRLNERAVVEVDEDGGV